MQDIYSLPSLKVPIHSLEMRSEWAESLTLERTGRPAAFLVKFF